jgi:hypothetical protein
MLLIQRNLYFHIFLAGVEKKPVSQPKFSMVNLILLVLILGYIFNSFYFLLRQSTGPVQIPAEGQRPYGGSAT